MLERIAEGLHFPTSITFDVEGRVWVAESGLPFAGAPPGGRVLRFDVDAKNTAARRTTICEGLKAPVTGLTRHEGRFLLSEGGYPGRISWLEPSGKRTVVVDGLPGLGNYHTNMALVGPDQKIYFAQGAATNLGVVGHDANDLAWLKRLPHNHDIPGLDIVLSGQSFESPDPRYPGEGRIARTGAFLPFGTPGEANQRVDGRVPCTASVMRCGMDGSGLELFVWGLRSAFGLLFLPDGRLLALDQGADDRGSRPVGNAPDVLFEVTADRFYGWPDFIDGLPITDDRFVPTRGPRPQMLLSNHSSLPPLARPLLALPVNCAATKMALLPPNSPRFPGQLLVCFFGDERPMTGPPGPRVGRSLARIDMSDWSLHAVELGPFHRPIDVQIDPTGEYAYVIDFGHFELLSGGGMEATAGSGALYRIPLHAI